MRNVNHLLAVVVRLPIVLAVVWFNVNLWTLDPRDYDHGVSPPTGALDGLVEDLEAGAGEEMQALFPEGFVITHAIVGFSWVDVALRASDEPAIRDHALAQARRMEARIDTDEARTIFPEAVEPAYGAFYRGYRAWLRGGILRADPAPPADEVARFRGDCDEIAEAFRSTDTPYLESYAGAAWPGDSVFLVASLALHDAMFEPHYADVVRRWVDMSKSLVDDERGLVPHAVDPETGQPKVASRGLSSALMSRMLYEVDPDFAADQWRRTREHFVSAHAGLFPGVLEFARGTSGRGDVDSGPLIFGFSGSAGVVAIAAARLHGDLEYADPTMIGAHAVGMPLAGRYGFGVLPVGEAFFSWAKTTTPWVGPRPVTSVNERLMLPGWRVVWGMLGVVFLACLFLPDLVLWRRRRRIGNFESGA